MPGGQIRNIFLPLTRFREFVKMRKIAFLSVLSVLFISCGGSRPSSFVHNRGEQPGPLAKQIAHDRSSTEKDRNNRFSRSIAKRNEEVEIPELQYFDENQFRKVEIIDYAKSFQGTRYKFGGNTKAGMDCSGLVCSAFEQQDIQLPRMSREMATKGLQIALKEVEPGDLIFFKTNNQRTINHVGLVVESEDGDIRFIHSTTQRGVIISSMDEAYWKRSFVQARRVI